MKMKKITLLLAGMAVIVSCSKSPKQTDTENTVENMETTAEELPFEEDNNTSATFSMDHIPFSESNLGDFPFFSAPEGALYINKAKPIDFDFIVFVTPDDIFEVEGKTFRAHVHNDKKSEKEISGRYLIKSYEDAIIKAGGVKVFEGKLDKKQLEKYKELCTYAGSNGSIDVWNNPIATYVIRRNDGNIYIAMDKGKTNTTSIQIVQEKPFEQTIQKITADEIAKDLTEKGKSILYINFDVDKSTITPDGDEVVNQITEALEKETSLKILIEGHTDNSGNASHNKKLSEDRANAVMNALTTKGIDKSRLSAKGFGAERPLVPNDSEENKTKNRRVELVKQ